MSGSSSKKRRARICAVLLSALLIAQALCAEAFAVQFTDSADIGEVYRKAVEVMAEKGVLSGFPDGSLNSMVTPSWVNAGLNIIVSIARGSMYLAVNFSPPNPRR